MPDQNINTAAAEATEIIAEARHGSLGTLMVNEAPNAETPIRPFVSLVNVAPGFDRSSPTVDLLLSTLAIHTRNLGEGGPASLLLQRDATGETDSDILTTSRISLIGVAQKSSEKDYQLWRDNYLRYHPAAEHYINFADFHAYSFRIDQVHLVAGFGRIETFDGRKLIR